MVDTSAVQHQHRLSATVLDMVDGDLADPRLHPASP